MPDANQTCANFKPVDFTKIEDECNAIDRLPKRAQMSLKQREKLTAREDKVLEKSNDPLLQEIHALKIELRKKKTLFAMQQLADLTKEQEITGFIPRVFAGRYGEHVILSVNNEIDVMSPKETKEFAAILIRHAKQSKINANRKQKGNFRPKRR